MTIDQHRIIRTYAEAARATHPALTRLDQLAGDGDYGDNLCAGLDAAVQALDEMPDEPGIATAANVFLDEVGGTSGPLLGLLLSEIARALDSASDEHAAWFLGVRDGLAAIQRVGEAEPGDRTMVDALAPARDSLSGGASYTEVAHAALGGARSTADIRARQGRASYVGDRVIGAPDPGAMGVALLFFSLATVADAEAAAGLGQPADIVPLPVGEV